MIYRKPTLLIYTCYTQLWIFLWNQKANTYIYFYWSEETHLDTKQHHVMPVDP